MREQALSGHGSLENTDVVDLPLSCLNVIDGISLPRALLKATEGFFFCPTMGQLCQDLVLAMSSPQTLTGGSIV